MKPRSLRRKPLRNSLERQPKSKESDSNEYMEWFVNHQPLLGSCRQKIVNFQNLNDEGTRNGSKHILAGAAPLSLSCYVIPADWVQRKNYIQHQQGRYYEYCEVAQLILHWVAVVEEVVNQNNREHKNQDCAADFGVSVQLLLGFVADGIEHVIPNFHVQPGGDQADR